LRRALGQFDGNGQGLTLAVPLYEPVKFEPQPPVSESECLRAIRAMTGQAYWITLLSKTAGIRFRDTVHGALAGTSQESTLLSLRMTWTTGTTFTRAPASGYGSP
jgi:hypothetical protein